MHFKSSFYLASMSVSRILDFSCWDLENSLVVPCPLLSNKKFWLNHFSSPIQPNVSYFNISARLENFLDKRTLRERLMSVLFLQIAMLQLWLSLICSLWRCSHQLKLQTPCWKNLITPFFFQYWTPKENSSIQ